MISRFLSQLSISLNRLNGFLERNCNPLKTSNITLKTFVDLDSDVVGLYAHGHHDQRQFLTAVRKRQSCNFVPRSTIQWGWATVHNNEFTWLDDPREDAIPITLIELES